MNRTRGFLGGLSLLLIVGSGNIVRSIPEGDRLHITLVMLALIGISIFWGMEVEKLRGNKSAKK